MGVVGLFRGQTTGAGFRAREGGGDASRDGTILASWVFGGGRSRDSTALARSKVPRPTPHLLRHYLHPSSSHNSTSHSSSSHASSLSSSKLISSRDMPPFLGNLSEIKNKFLLQQILKSSFMLAKSSVMEPDPDWIQTQSGPWIRIRMHNPERDPGWQK